jgi:hypothetical protein
LVLSPVCHGLVEGEGSLGQADLRVDPTGSARALKQDDLGAVQPGARRELFLQEPFSKAMLDGTSIEISCPNCGSSISTTVGQARRGPTVRRISIKASPMLRKVSTGCSASVAPAFADAPCLASPPSRVSSRCPGRYGIEQARENALDALRTVLTPDEELAGETPEAGRAPQTALASRQPLARA